jgi:hypothetical protein
VATPAEIANSASCFACVPNQADALLYLLNEIRVTGGGAAMTPAEIAEAAKCYSCVPNKQDAILYLLEAINANGGGGGGGGSGVTCSAASDPSGTPTGNCGIWVRLDTGQMWVYNSGSASWNLLLS